MKLRQIGWYWTEPTGLECFGRMADSAVAEAIGADPVYTLSERVQIPPEIEHVTQAVRLEFKAGDTMWSEEQTHIGDNIGDTPTHVIMIEVKK